MSRSPVTDAAGGSTADYLGAFDDLARRVRDGQSFSGRERNCGFLNSRGPRFADISAVAGLDDEGDARAMGITDWDGDGDLDLWVSNRTAPRLRFLSNSIASPDHRWIAFLLQGNPARNCPRDAIGARVKVTAGGQTISRTLAAGEGFLSQSSKTMVIGLGTAGAVEGVIVRWPAGGVEEFGAPEAGASYRLVQGTGRAEKLPAYRPAPRVAAAPAGEHEGAAEVRIRLSQPLKMPAFNYQTVDGSTADLETHWRERPVLVNLWATWCAPCAAELREFGSLADAVGVLPLNIENIAKPGSISGDRAKAFLVGVGFSGRSGFGDAALVGALDSLIRQTIYRVPQLPVPVSFLIDSGGWLSAVYMGRVSTGQLRADVATLGGGAAAALRAALPMPGPWARERLVAHPIAIAQSWLEGGYVDEARQYLTRQLERQPAGVGDAKWQFQRAEMLVWLGRIDREAGRAAEAHRHFQAAVEANPNWPPAQVDLAFSLADAGSREQAVALLEAARARAPGTLEFGTALGDLHRQRGDWKRSLEEYRAVVRAHDRFVPALNNLAWLLATVPDDALRNGDEAVRLADHLMTAPGAASVPAFLSTRAAACAEAHDFETAIALTDSVTELARRRGDQAALDMQKRRRAQFAAKQAWREP